MSQVSGPAVILFLASIVSAGGCTIRYSQTIAGRLEKVDPVPIQNADGGIEVGIGFGASPVVVTFVEPMSSEELLAIPCDSGIIQVDYRALAYGYYVAVNFPEVKTISYCVAKP